MANLDKKYCEISEIRVFPTEYTMLKIKVKIPNLISQNVYAKKLQQTNII